MQDGLFIKNGKIKSTALLNGFVLSIAFITVYILIFAASGAALKKIIPETTDNMLLVWLPPLFTSLIASLICALPFLFISHDDLCITAFVLLAVYAVLIIAAVLLKYDAESRALLIEPLIFYLALPAASGNMVCQWALRVKHLREAKTINDNAL